MINLDDLGLGFFLLGNARFDKDATWLGSAEQVSLDNVLYVWYDENNVLKLEVGMNMPNVVMKIRRGGQELLREFFDER